MRKDPLHLGIAASFLLALAACGDASTTGATGGAGGEAATTSTVTGSGGDASSSSATSSGSSGGGGALPSLTPCPTQGKGAIVTAGPCHTLTPEEAGAGAMGVNADVPQYALEPSGAAKGALVLYLNASLSSPAMQIADPQKNFYNAAEQAGYHVLVIAYRSNSVIALLCGDDPACYALARRTVVLGAHVAGAPASLADMREDEGIVQRTDAALQLLAKARPGSGWEQFLASPTDADVTKRIAWSRVIVAGHSQGGGHAAFLASLVPLRRVVQLSSTCDAVGAAPVPWTSAGNTWALQPATGFVGFAAPTTFDATGKPTGGDTICPRHFAVWQNMGLDPSRMHDDAATCGAAGNTHGAAIGCTDNYAAWGTLFE